MLPVLPLPPVHFHCLALFLFPVHTPALSLPLSIFPALPLPFPVPLPPVYDPALPLSFPPFRSYCLTHAFFLLYAPCLALGHVHSPCPFPSPFTCFCPVLTPCLWSCPALFLFPFPPLHSYRLLHCKKKLGEISTPVYGAAEQTIQVTIFYLKIVTWIVF